MLAVLGESINGAGGQEVINVNDGINKDEEVEGKGEWMGVVL